MLLSIAKLSKSSYYYIISAEDKDVHNDKIIKRITEIYDRHKGRYGYRRITTALRQLEEPLIVNHKKVKRLMSKLGLYSIQRKRRKYSSYKGTVGKIADNIIKQNFFADEINKKWYTDVTEFNLRGEKLYLSPILDGNNYEIVAYDIATSANLEQIKRMLDRAFENKENLGGMIFHSDQGWQYQHETYQKRLKEKGIIQSMSRKGNCMDNGLMENFFGILKCEMFYNQKHKYDSLESLRIAIEEYIYYYNNKRIKCKLKGLTPVEFRNQSLKIA